MTGERSYTTKIWRPPSLIGFSSADALSTSMDPPGEPVISTWKRPCQKIQNGSEFPELMAQNSRNPQSQFRRVALIVTHRFQCPLAHSDSFLSARVATNTPTSS